ncbi:MAG: response regulator [Phormidesmis sp.]
MATALIVEDSLTDRTLLTRYLQQAGMRVTSARSSEEARAMLQSAPPDMVFLDVVLPGQSGFELCHDLKTNKSTQNIPIVLCSTKDTEADKLWGAMLGADAYLTKPLSLQLLAKTVAQLMPKSDRPAR